MSSRHSGRTALSVALALVLLAAAFAGLGASRLAAAHAVVVATSNNLADTAVENFQFSTPEFSNVPTTGTITVAFSNDDTSGNDHSFAILDREGWVIPKSGDIPTLLSTWGTLVWINASQGQTKSGSFAAPATGWYEFLCTVAGHFQAGMYGFIAFGEPLPANLTVGPLNEGPGLAVFLIVGTIVALTVIAIVLGFVVGRRHGAKHEMPPERLGYPEPAGPLAPDEPRSGA